MYKSANSRSLNYWQRRLRHQRFYLTMLAIAFAIIGVAKITHPAFAQESPLVYGVRATSGEVVLESLDLTNDQLQSNVQTGITLEANERLSGFTSLADGTFTLATAPTTAAVNGGANLSRLISFVGSPQPQIAVFSELPGLAKNNTIESLLATQDGKLLSILSLNQGTPPFSLATIDRNNGQVSPSSITLPPERRFSNLTQCPDGTIYLTSLGRSDSTSLVQLDLQQEQLISLPRLTFNNMPLSNDLAGLACSGSNQLYALSNPSFQGTNSLFTLDASTGVMSLVKPFAVDKITFKSHFGQTTQSVFTTQVPSFEPNDGIPYELGMKFQSAKPGQITAIRYWKAASEAGVHVGKLWIDGTLLASVTFSDETQLGWQQAALSTPLDIAANTTYVVSVNANSSYGDTYDQLATPIVNNDLSSVADGNNGVYGSLDSFPMNSYRNSNYFRDIVFTATANPATN